MKTLIKQVNVFDGVSSQLQEGKSIVIEDNLVKEILSGQVSEEHFDTVIDGGGRTAMPGMVDAHVHLGAFFPATSELDFAVASSAAIAGKILMQGFTTVRDAGGVVQGLKKAFDQNLLPGPRIFPSNSFISQTCGHGDDDLAHSRREIQYQMLTSSVLADGVDQMIRAVREQFYKGASQIKIMAGGGCSSQHDPIPTVQFTEAEMRAAVEVAGDYGTYVMAHLYTAPSMMRAAKAGVRSFEHAHMMDEEAARVIQAQGIFVAPMPQFNKVVEGIPTRVSKKGELVRKHEAIATDLINKYGLTILFGTDLMIHDPAMTPQESVDLTYYEKRFGTMSGLRAATGNYYEISKLTTYQNPYPEGKVGVLEPGSYADVLVVDGDPTQRLSILSDTDNIRVIMKDGVLYKDTL
ncbi:MAG: amidohydrolase family protein [Acutalibacter sp.]